MTIDFFIVMYYNDNTCYKEKIYMNYLQEKINPKKYNSQIESLYGKLKHMIVDEKDLKNVVQIFQIPDTDEVASIVINAKANIDDRLKWKDEKEDKIAGILSCEEIIERNLEGNYIHTFYSFHFEAAPSSDVKTFRVDYKPDQQTPLHAHASDYNQTHLHLTYPNETSLKLHHIDFCTVMLVVSYYIKHQDKYPLFSGREYNSRIDKKRRRYDEHREN